MVINDKKFAVHDGNKAELKELAKIAERESGQKQFLKQGICTFILACVIFMNALLPT